jgi:hypothetical protein
MGAICPNFFGLGHDGGKNHRYNAEFRCGGVPEWLKGADCKSVGLRLRWFESSLLHQQRPYLVSVWKFRVLCAEPLRKALHV